MAGWKIAIRRFVAACCARATSGQLAAAPPSAPRNSRRLMFSVQAGTQAMIAVQIAGGRGWRLFDGQFGRSAAFQDLV
jgi:hypothetical protein